MALLLDTHIWIWYLESDEKRLSKKTVEHVRAAEARGEVFVSDISFWEVANKSTRRKFFSIDAILWLQRAATAPGLRYIPVERAALVQSTQLSGTAPRDPADRILIATAQLNGASLVTADKQILAYARRERGISIYDAGP
jgi:PIN domain nuclease of toxin-antitoxin system